MLSAERHGALAEILSLTMRESDAAADGQWEDVRSMDRRRLELLTKFFEVPLAADERDALGYELNRLVTEDRKLLDRVRSARGDVAGRMRRRNRQRDGAAAYEAVDYDRRS